MIHDSLPVDVDESICAKEFTIPGDELTKDLMRVSHKFWPGHISKVQLRINVSKTLFNRSQQFRAREVGSEESLSCTQEPYVSEEPCAKILGFGEQCLTPRSPRKVKCYDHVSFSDVG